MQPDNTVPQTRSREQSILIGVAAAAAIITFIIAVFDLPRFFQAYFIGYMFWVEIAVGCLGLVMLNNLVKARWLYPILRFAEAGTRTLPLMAVLFLPIVFGLGEIYPWVGEAAAELKGGKAVMLQPTFFVLRSFIYIAVWSFLGYMLTNWSYKRDQDVNAVSEDSMRNFSAVGGIFYVLTTSLAGFDWTMSLVPEFFSSAFGWAVLSRMWLAAFAFIIVVLAIYWNRGALAAVVNKQVTNDLGAMLLVSVLVWVYFYGIQIVIIYSGNVSYNVLWFDARLAENWRFITNLFVVLNVALLLLLMIPGIKGRRGNLVALAGFTLLLRAFELHWVVMPTYEGPAVQVWDFVPIFAVGAVWLLVAAYFLRRHPLLPAHHPSLEGEPGSAGAADAYTASEGI